MIKSYSKYIKELFTLAMPIIMGNLSMILVGAGDVFVAAKHSTHTLAAISIGNSITSIIFMFGLGLLLGISPLLSNFRGERNNVKKYFIPTITFAMILATLSLNLILMCSALVDNLGFEQSLVPLIKKYMFICAFSVFGSYLQISLKEFLQAYEIVIVPNLLNVISVFVNILLNFILVFGWFGLPEMGSTGLAVATLLSRSIFGVLMLLYCLKIMTIRYYKDFEYFVNLLKISVPIAMAMVLEVAAFNSVTILIGRVSGLYAAAQNILLILTTITFMIPVAISNAIAVKVGFANGARNFVDLKRYSFTGVGISLGFMSLCAVSFLLFPKFFVNIFTQDPALIKICAPIIILAGLFQIFDGLQVSLGGVFKGLKKTNIVMLGNFGAYWLIGLPMGFLLAFKYHLNLYGFWIGLTISIFLLGIIFILILLKQFKKLDLTK